MTHDHVFFLFFICQGTKLYHYQFLKFFLSISWAFLIMILRKVTLHITHYKKDEIIYHNSLDHMISSWSHATIYVYLFMDG